MDGVATQQAFKQAFCAIVGQQVVQIFAGYIESAVTRQDKTQTANLGTANDFEQGQGIETGDDFAELQAQSLSQSAFGQVHVKDGVQGFVGRCVVFAHHGHAERHGHFCRAGGFINKVAFVRFGLGLENTAHFLRCHMNVKHRFALS
jgi:hypothetical protein